MEDESQGYTISDRLTPIKLRNWLQKIGIETQISKLQKTVPLQNA